MKAIERLNGLKTWISEHLEHDEVTILHHALDAVIKVITKLNKKVETQDDLIISLGVAGTFIELNVPSACACGTPNARKLKIVESIRTVLLGTETEEVVTV